jgi:hypothetical protein
MRLLVDVNQLVGLILISIDLMDCFYLEAYFITNRRVTMKKILVPTDFSAFAQNALEIAADIALKTMPQSCCSCK